MLDQETSTERTVELYEYIKDPAAREAFMLLIGAVTCVSSVTWRHKKQGAVRSIGIYEGQKWAFSIMPSMSKVRFQFRPPAVSGGGLDKQALAAAFPDSDDTSHEGHWNVDLRGIEDCRRLIQHLKW